MPTYNHIMGTGSTKLIDTNDVAQGLIIHENTLGNSSVGHLIAEGVMEGHTPLFLSLIHI